MKFRNFNIAGESYIHETECKVSGLLLLTAM